MDGTPRERTAIASAHGSSSPWVATRSVIVLACGLVVACGGSRAPASASTVSPHATMGQEAAIARARSDSARFPYTEADVRFMSTMIAHHAQAVQMARWALTHAANASVVRLAERIINGQTDEITLVGQWLRDRQRPVPAADPNGMRMTMGGAEHVMRMPGMLSEEQMHRLDAARGRDFDTLFLTSMIEHHRGAVAMVKELLASYGAGQDVTVFKFASDVQVDQTTEINRMRQMLDELAASPRSP